MAEGFNLPDPTTMIGLLAALSLLPFVVIMVTSYVKLIVVMNLVRNALGVQQIPPNMVINGMAIILSVYIMAPVIQESYDLLVDQNITFQGKDIKEILASASEASGPIKGFLDKHSLTQDRNFFIASAKALWAPGQADGVDAGDFLVLIPAFIVHELTTAFEIGFMIYLPFIVVDLIVSNILLAMGMMMVSPMTISLPFKLLLFVLISGWSRLIHGLVLTYK